MRIKDSLKQILILKETPHRIALAFSVGVFIGMSPLLGLHTIMGLAFAFIFRFNKLVTLIGVYITNPWTIVPIYTFEIWVGSKIMGIKDIIPEINLSEITLLSFFGKFNHLVLPFFAGATFIGLMSAILSYFIIYYIIRAKNG